LVPLAGSLGSFLGLVSALREYQFFGLKYWLTLCRVHQTQRTIELARAQFNLARLGLKGVSR
jgi:hypothetical protein